MAPTDGSLIFVRAFLNSLLGEKCWSVIAGPGTGSMVSIALGRQIPRVRPLKNPMLSEVEREFEGEKMIFIKDAAWTLECKGRVVCTNEDSKGLDGPMVSGLRNLVGRGVVSARLIGKLGDFEVIFEDDQVLRVLHTTLDPKYPGATDRLAETLSILYATAPPSAVPPTVTSTPTRDPRPVQELFSHAQSLVAGAQWDQAIETLLALRQADPTHQIARVDGMLYISLRQRGVSKIWDQGNLGGGAYDLALAERFAPLDVQATSWRELARLYLFGSSFWGVIPEQAVYYFSQVAAAAPGLRDSSGVTAAERYRLPHLRDCTRAACEGCHGVQSEGILEREEERGDRDDSQDDDERQRKRRNLVGHRPVDDDLLDHGRPSALASENLKVVCVDADIGLRNLDVVLGLENRIVYDLVDVVDGRCRLRQAMIRDKRLPELYLIPAAQTRDKSAISPSDMVRLCDDLRPDHDWILIDSPAGIERGFRNAIAPADIILLVTNPEISGARRRSHHWAG